MNLPEIKSQIRKEIQKARQPHDLEMVYLKYLGKKGELTKILKSLKDLPLKQRQTRGKLINVIKAELTRLLEQAERKLAASPTQAQRKSLDVTAPGSKMSHGHLHPLIQVRQMMEEIFKSLGFSLVEGPEVTTEYYNFDALNIPEDHPARDLMNTFWLKSDRRNEAAPRSYKRERLLLRTHTSAMQVPYMEAHQPPFSIIIPGLVFRYDASDASHDVQFYQLEGLMVDREISVANFRAVIETVFKRVFKKDIKMRLRPGYFPFTEPSFEVDLTCVRCQGRGCALCSQTGWLEIMGAGMVHPNVLAAAKIDPGEWQGFAFGMGLDRIAMIKYGIDDIRLFYSGDQRFIRQF